MVCRLWESTTFGIQGGPCSHTNRQQCRIVSQRYVLEEQRLTNPLASCIVEQINEEFTR